MLQTRKRTITYVVEVAIRCTHETVYPGSDLGLWCLVSWTLCDGLEAHHECNLCIIYCVTAVILKTDESSLRTRSNFDNTKLVGRHESNAGKRSRFYPISHSQLDVPQGLALSHIGRSVSPRQFMETATCIVTKLIRLGTDIRAKNLVGYPGVTRDLAYQNTHSDHSTAVTLFFHFNNLLTIQRVNKTLPKSNAGSSRRLTLN